VICANVRAESPDEPLLQSGLGLALVSPGRIKPEIAREAATVVRTSRVTTRIAMSGRQERQKKRQMLEPVLENYSSYGCNSVLSERHHDLPASNPATSQVIICNQPASNSKSPKRSSTSTTSINPMSLLGKLRDRYVKLMNDVAMGGDFTCVASYGCQIAPDYPGTLEVSRTSKEQREMEVWRQQAVEVLQRDSSRESERREPIGAQ